MTKLRVKQPGFFWRLLSIALVVVLVSGLIIPMAVEAILEQMPAAPEGAPTVTIVAANINNDYLELGLSVNSLGTLEDGTTKENFFQSVGAVLKYDPEKLEPVTWSGGNNPTAVPIGTTAWQTVLQTKKDNENVSATALTYREDATGYLYLSAEAAVPEELHQQLPQVTTTPEPEPEPEPEPTEPDQPSEPEAQDEEGGENPTDPSEGEEPTNPPGGEENPDEPENPPQPVEWPTEKYVPVTVNEELQESAVGQVVTVRFRYKMDDTVAAESRFLEALRGIDLLSADTAEVEVAKSSPADGNIRYYGAETAKALSPHVQLLYLSQALTVNTGGNNATAADFGAVVIYDWDGTLLGSLTVKRDASQKDIEDEINAFAERLMAPADKQDEYGYYAGDENDPGSNYPLTYKKAYRFEGVWLNQESDAFECYKDENITYASEPANHGLLSDYTAEEYPDYAGLAEKGYVMVKAAYKAEANINTGLQGGEYFYSETGISYTRYGAAAAATGTYSIKLNFNRQNEKGIGVSRLRSPGLMVEMVPNIQGAATVYSLLRLGTGDEEQVEVVAAKQVKTVRYTIIETYGVANWTAATSMSNTATKLNYETARGDPGFVRDGTVGYINELAIAYNQGVTSGWGSVNIVAIQDTGFKRQGKAITAAQVNSIVKPAILAAVAANGNKPLTWQQMQDAIDNS